MSDKLQNPSKKLLSYLTIFYCVVFTVVVRVLCELFLLDYNIEKGMELGIARFFLENIYYFLILFTISSVFVNKMTAVPLRQVMSFGVKFYPIIIIPPIIDVMVGRTAGYHYASAENYAANIFSISFLPGDASLGLSIEVLIGLIGVCTYVFLKTRKLSKVLITFLFMDVLLVTLSTPDLFFGQGKGAFIYDYFLPTYYFLPFVLLMSFVTWLYQKEKLFAVINNFRWVRSLMFVATVFLGGAIRQMTVNDFYLLNTVLASLAIFLVWQVSIIINDIHDLSIDRVSNQSRPLVQGVITIPEYNFVCIIFSFLSLSLALVVNFNVFYFTAFTLFLAVIYSKPPIRLRQNMLGNIMIGVALLVCYIVGIYAAEWRPIDLVKVVSDRVFNLGITVFACGTLISMVKDIKDVEGDKQHGIQNVFTIFGKEQGKMIMTILIVFTMSIPTLIFMNPIIFGLGCLAAFVYYKFEHIQAVYILSSLAIVMILLG